MSKMIHQIRILIPLIILGCSSCNGKCDSPSITIDTFHVPQGTIVDWITAINRKLETLHFDLKIVLDDAYPILEGDVPQSRSEYLFDTEFTTVDIRETSIADVMIMVCQSKKGMVSNAFEAKHCPLDTILEIMSCTFNCQVSHDNNRIIVHLFPERLIVKKYDSSTIPCFRHLENYFQRWDSLAHSYFVSGIQDVWKPIALYSIDTDVFYVVASLDVHTRAMESLEREDKDLPPESCFIASPPSVGTTNTIQHLRDLNLSIQ